MVRSLLQKKHIAAQATGAMFCLLKKARSLLLPIDIQIDMFEKTVKPILLYQGALTLSMFSNRSVKMTSNYPTSCLEV